MAKTGLNDLAERLINLNIEAKLTKPLLVSDLEVTVHMYQACEDKTDIRETFLAKVLPAPPVESEALLVAVGGEAPAVGSEVLAMRSEASAMESQAPAVGSEVPPVGSEVPPVGGEVPPVGCEAPTEFKISFRDIFGEDTTVGVDPTDSIIFSLVELREFVTKTLEDR